MNLTSKYLLLLDPSSEVLNLQETSLHTYYGGDVLALQRTSDLEDIFVKRGDPELIVADEGLVSELKKLNFKSPLIVSQKPLNISSFDSIVKGYVEASLIKPNYVPVRASTILKHGISICDLYLKLSERNLVKLFHRGELFAESDFKKLEEKGVTELFIKLDDCIEFLKFLESELSKPAATLENITLTIENLEAFEKIGKSLNWSPEVLQTAQMSVNQAVKILSKNQNVMKVIKQRLSETTTNYSRHIGLLSYLVCAFSSSIGFTGESGQIKLALAALIHDASVDDAFYENLKEWDRRAADLTDKTPETMKYRMHPFEASKLVKSLDIHSPDVDQIILQHHEMKNGKGFPRGLDAHRIGHLSSIFIMVEDLVEFIDDGENIETSITDFLTWGSAFYDSGHFKKIFKAFEDNLKRPVDE